MRHRIMATGYSETMLPTSDTAGTEDSELLHIVSPSDIVTNCRNEQGLTQAVFYEFFVNCSLCHKGCRNRATNATNTAAGVSHLA
jgi:hypothetical protein